MRVNDKGAINMYSKTLSTSTLVLGLIFLTGILTAPGASSAAEKDTVILKDGRKKVGKITSETDAAVYLEIEPGEVLPIARTRIDHIVKAAAAEENKGPRVAVQNQNPTPRRPAIDADHKRIYEKIKDLGHADRDKRRAAMKNALDLGFRAVPILSAFFHPKQRTTSSLQIGALRALAELGPLDDETAKTLGWVALRSTDYEVMREACRTIRILKEDRALSYVLGFATSKNREAQMAAARALREINDDRAFAALAGSIPPPKVNANVPQSSARVREMKNMPLGNGLRGSLFLPESEVMGTVENTMSPEAETLTLIAQKDMGGSQGVWINWLNEKIGTWTQREREEARRKRGRSIIGKTGTPQAGQ